MPCVAEAKEERRQGLTVSPGWQDVPTPKDENNNQHLSGLIMLQNSVRCLAYITSLAKTLRGRSYAYFMDEETGLREVKASA